MQIRILCDKGNIVQGMRVWCLEPVVGFSIWLTDGMEVSPLKDNILFICCQGNKPFQRKWLFVCVYGPRSICPFGKAHSPPWLKGCTFLAKSNFDGLVLVHHFLDWRIEGEPGQVTWDSQDVFFSLVLVFSFGASTAEPVNLKSDSTKVRRIAEEQGEMEDAFLIDWSHK